MHVICTSKAVYARRRSTMARIAARSVGDRVGQASTSRARLGSFGPLSGVTAAHSAALVFSICRKTFLELLLTALDSLPVGDSIL
jgi:hypothetical protein